MEVKQVVPGCPSPATPITHTKLGNFEILAYASDTKVVIMTSQLTVLQILDLPWRTAEEKHDRDHAERKNKATSGIPRNKSTTSFGGYSNTNSSFLYNNDYSSGTVSGQASGTSSLASSGHFTQCSSHDARGRDFLSKYAKKPIVSHLEWQGHGRATLGVCIGRCVVLFHPISKKALMQKASKNAPQLLPHLKSIYSSWQNPQDLTQDNKTATSPNSSTTQPNPPNANTNSTLPCIISSTILSHPSLRLETVELEDITDLNDLLFQERMTIVHEFQPTSVSFTYFSDYGEYMLVGGGQELVLWKLRREVLDPPERPLRGSRNPSWATRFSGHENFSNIGTRLGAKIGINGIVALAETKPSKMLPRKDKNQTPTLKPSTDDNIKLPPFPEWKVPYGNVRSWYDDDDEDGNSLFPKNTIPYRLLWKRMVNGVNIVSFSPDGRLFASVGPNDRHVKVWFYGANGIDFMYLAHPRAVADIQWRKFHVKREFSRNVIMTRLVDGTCMLWEETEACCKLEFVLRLTLTERVTSVQWLLPPVSYLTDILDEHSKERVAKEKELILNSAGSKDILIPGQSTAPIPPSSSAPTTPSKSKTSSQQDQLLLNRLSSYVPSHAPSSSSSFFLPLPQQPKSLCPFDCQHRILNVVDKEKLHMTPLDISSKETQDWVAALQKDGSILLWKVKGLGVPKRVPAATLWSRLRHVLSSKVDDFYPHLVVLSQRFAFKERDYHPALLNVYTSSVAKRDISCWTVDTSVINRAQAQLSRRLQGHVSSIHSLQSHPGNSLFASSDKHRTVIWRLADTTISDSTFVLQDLCGLPTAKLAKWDHADPLIYLYHHPDSTSSRHHLYPSLTSATNSQGQRSGIIAYLVDHNENDTASSSAWASSKNLGSLEGSAKLVDEEGDPVLLGHLEVLPPVYFDEQGNCIKLDPLESLVLGASVDGKVIFVWLITKVIKTPAAMKPTITKASVSSKFQGGLADPSTRSLAQSSVGSPASHGWMAASAEIPTLVALSNPLFPSISPSASTPISSQKSLNPNSQDSSHGNSNSGTQSGMKTSFIIKSRLIVRYVIPENARISCLTKPVSTHMKDLRQHMSDASLLTGGVDGIIRAWRLHKCKSPVPSDATLATPQLNGFGPINTSSTPSSHQPITFGLDAYEWLPLLYFRAHDQPVYSIRCASFGRIATTSIAGDEIKVWECESSSPNFLLESVISSKEEAPKAQPSTASSAFGGFSAASAMTSPESRASQLNASTVISEEDNFEDDDTVDLDGLSFNEAGMKKKIKSTTCFDWISGPTGSPMLAIVSEGSTRVFALHATTNLLEFKPMWKQISTAKISGSVVAWTGLGQLVVGQGNRLMVFTNWLEENTLTAIAEDWHAALPFYHPKVLFEVIMAGRLDRAHTTFKALYASLSKILPQMFQKFENDTEAQQADYSKIEYGNTDADRMAELLRHHDELQKRDDIEAAKLKKELREERKQKKQRDSEIAKAAAEKDGKEYKEEPDDDSDDENLGVDEVEDIEEITCSVEPLPFEKDAELTEVGKIYLEQKNSTTILSESSLPQADAIPTLPVVSLSADEPAPVPTIADAKTSPPASITVPDIDMTSYHPAGMGMDEEHGNSSEDDFWGDKNSKQDGHVYDMSRYSAYGDDPGNNADKESDDEDDFWSEKRSSKSTSVANAPTATTKTDQPEHQLQTFRWNFPMISQQNASALCYVLSKCKIEGLLPEEQATLIALIDTLRKLETTWLDAAAVRFTVASRFFFWMQSTNKTLSQTSSANHQTTPNIKPAQHEQTALPSLVWCWALHSADQQSLLEHCFPNSSIVKVGGIQNTTSSAAANQQASRFPLLWDTLRSLGVPLWLTNIELLKSLCQDLSNTHFALRRDPADAALFFLLLGKKTALAALYKVKDNHALANFLSNDFNEKRWKSAASDNAGVLIGKQNFRMAAAIFVLGGFIREAVDVCIHRLQDWMLALFIARLSQHIDQGAQYKRVLQDLLLNARCKGDHQMESLTLWLLKDYRAALGSLIPQAPKTTVLLAPQMLIPSKGLLKTFAHASKLQAGTTGIHHPNNQAPSPVPSSGSSRKEKPSFFDDSDGSASDEYNYKQFDIRTGMEDIYKGFDLPPTSPSPAPPQTEPTSSETTGISPSFDSSCTRRIGVAPTILKLASSTSLDSSYYSIPFQTHLAVELTPIQVNTASVTPDFNPGIRSLFEFVFSHPTLQMALQENESSSSHSTDPTMSTPHSHILASHQPSHLSRANSGPKSTSLLRSTFSAISQATQSITSPPMSASSSVATLSDLPLDSEMTQENKHAADLLMLGELRMKDFLHRKIVYTYIHSGLSRLVLQQDLDELAERVNKWKQISGSVVSTSATPDLLPSDNTVPIEDWILDASQSRVVGVGSELVARELEFKCAIQFLSKEIEANRLLKNVSSLDTYNQFLQLILTYHSALTPDSIVAALGQFCEHRHYLFHHYLLLRVSSAVSPIIYTSQYDINGITAPNSQPAQSSQEKASEVTLAPIPSQPLVDTSGDATAFSTNSNSSKESPPASITLLPIERKPNESTPVDASPSIASAKNNVRDPSAAGQLLVRTALKITTLCHSLITNPLSPQQAYSTQLLANELGACLEMHVNDPTVTFSQKARAGVAASIRLGIFIAAWSTKDYETLFSLLSTSPSLANLLGSLPGIMDQRYAMVGIIQSDERYNQPSSSSLANPDSQTVNDASQNTHDDLVSPTPLRSPPPTALMPNPTNDDISTSTSQISASAPVTPVPSQSSQSLNSNPFQASQSVLSLISITPNQPPHSNGDHQSSILPLFPSVEELHQLRSSMQSAQNSDGAPNGNPSQQAALIKYFMSTPHSVSPQTELFLSRLLDVLVLVKFCNQQEEFLAQSFPNAPKLNMLTTLRGWQVHLENQLKDIPVQIIEERLQDITERESRFVFDMAFFAPFIRETKLYQLTGVVSRIWNLLASQACVAGYLQHADYLKQSMRFLRLHTQLRDDFDEQERNDALVIGGAWDSCNGSTPSSATALFSKYAPNETNNLPVLLVNFPIPDKEPKAHPTSIPLATTPATSSGTSNWSSTKTSKSGPSTKISIKLGDPYCIWKGRDTLISFCVNPTSRKKMAIATTSSIIEVPTEHKAPIPIYSGLKDAIASYNQSWTNNYNGQVNLSSSSNHISPSQQDGIGPLITIGPSSAASLGHRRNVSDGNLASLATSAATSNPSTAPSNITTGYLSGPMNAQQGGLLSMPGVSSHRHHLSLTPQPGIVGFSASTAIASQPTPASSSPALNGFIDLEAIKDKEVANWLESHPTLPYYLSASGDGPVKLWPFNVTQPDPLTIYRSKTKAKAVKIKFNHNGNKFAAVDSAGSLEVWKFDASEESIDPFLSLPCLKKGYDLAFLGAGSVLAIAGEGYGGKNVCIVDTLIDPKSAVVASFSSAESHSYHSTSMIYSPRYQMIYAGNSKGQICLFDIRRTTNFATVDMAHTKGVKDMFLDPSQSFYASGSLDGSVKFWNAQNGKEIAHWPNAHVPKGFRMTSSGVSQIRLTRNSIFTCGVDGYLYQRRYSAIEFVNPKGK